MVDVAGEAHPVQRRVSEAEWRRWRRDALAALESAQLRWDHPRPDEDGAFGTAVWLHAARSAWLLGDGDTARMWYVRVAEEVIDLAITTGTSVGSFAYFAVTALSAAVLSGRPPLVLRTAGTILSQPAPGPTIRRRGRWIRSADPASAGHQIIRAWAAWLQEDKREATLAVLAAGREAVGFPPMAEQRWRRSQWPEIVAALGALVDGRATPLRQALLALDEKLSREAEQLPVASAQLSEPLAALAGEWRRHFPRTYTTEGFRLPLALPSGGPPGGVLEGSVDPHHDAPDAPDTPDGTPDGAIDETPAGAIG